MLARFRFRQRAVTILDQHQNMHIERLNSTSLGCKGSVGKWSVKTAAVPKVAQSLRRSRRLPSPLREQNTCRCGCSDGAIAPAYTHSHGLPSFDEEQAVREARWRCADQLRAFRLTSEAWHTRFCRRNRGQFRRCSDRSNWQRKKATRGFQNCIRPRHARQITPMRQQWAYLRSSASSKEL